MVEIGLQFKIINYKSANPSDVYFGPIDNTKRKFMQNTAMLQNWTGYFFESEEIAYPDLPIMACENNRSACVWLSSLFEAFFFKAVSVLLKQERYNVIFHIVTLLIPSLVNEEHCVFLFECFRQALV